jgi:hypothetical protein
MLTQLLRLLWSRWKAFGHALATIQSRILLFVFYFVILGPFALVMRAFADPLGLRRGDSTHWLERAATKEDFTELARRQF